MWCAHGRWFRAACSLLRKVHTKPDLTFPLLRKEAHCCSMSHSYSICVAGRGGSCLRVLTSVLHIEPPKYHFLAVLSAVMALVPLAHRTWWSMPLALHLCFSNDACVDPSISSPCGNDLILGPGRDGSCLWVLTLNSMLTLPSVLPGSHGAGLPHWLLVTEPHVNHSLSSPCSDDPDP